MSTEKKVSDARRKFPFGESEVTISLRDARLLWTWAYSWARGRPCRGQGERAFETLNKVEPKLWRHDDEL